MKHRGRKSIAERETLASFAKPPRIVAANPYPHPPEPPADLGEPEKKIWRNIVAEYRGTLAAWDVLHNGLMMLRQAREAREVYEKEGICVANRDGNPRPHPAVKIERDGRRAFEATLKTLKIRL